MYNLLDWKYRVLRWNIEKEYRQQIKKNKKTFKDTWDHTFFHWNSFSLYPQPATEK